MKGTIKTTQKCGCNVPYKKKNTDKYGFFCPDCNSRPTRYVIDARSFDCGQIYSDVCGTVLDSYAMAEAILSSMRSAWTLSKKPNGKRFNPADYVPAKANELKFGNIAKDYLREQSIAVGAGDLAKATYQNQANALNNIFSVLDDKDIRDIEKSDLDSIYYDLKETPYNDEGELYSDRTIKDFFVVFRQVLKRILSPKDFPEFPKNWNRVIPKNEKQWMDIGEQILIHEKISDAHNNVYKLGISLLQEIGCRVGELLYLKKKHFINGYVIILGAISKDRKPKNYRKSGGQVKTPRISPELWKKIVEFLKDRDAEDYFVSYTGRQYMGRETLTRVWRNACKDAGVRYIKLQQSARHNLATDIMADAEDEALRKISKTLGNTEEVAREHYILNKTNLKEG